MDDLFEKLGAIVLGLLALAGSAVLLTVPVFVFWAIVNPDQLLMMVERVSGFTCADLPDILCR